MAAFAVLVMAFAFVAAFTISVVLAGVPLLEFLLAGITDFYYLPVKFRVLPAMGWLKFIVTFSSVTS